MPSKWEVNDAIQASHMAPNARLVMFVLISAADAETAEIPERFTPSLDDLVRRSGLSKSAVAEWLTVLEESGWIKRDRPTTAESLGSGRRTRYQLAIGDLEHSPKPQRVRKARPKVTDGSEHSTDTGVRVADSPRGGQSSAPEGPRGGQSGVRVADSDSPRGGHKSSSTYQAHLPPTGGVADAPPPEAEALFDVEMPPPPPLNGGQINRNWIDQCTQAEIKLASSVKARWGKAIAKALDDKYTATEIQAALTRMLDKGMTGNPAQLDSFLSESGYRPKTHAAKPAVGASKVSAPEQINKWDLKGTS